MLDSIYIEVSYVRNLYEINLEGERKILKKHKKVVKELNLVTPPSEAQKINRLVPLAKELQDSIEEMYISKSNKGSKVARLHLRELIENKQEDTVGSFLFGVGIGIGVSIIGLVIALQQLNLPNLDSDPIFSRDFPVWRGIGFFLIYMWVLALNVFMFERHHINHKLIFKFTDYHASTSVEAFYRASIFSAVYLILFLLYIIQRVYNTDFFPSARIYLGGIVWIMFVLYIVFPFKLFNWKGRLYMWKIIVLCIVAPFRGVTFPLVWTTDQFISLVNPLKDFAYTVCYYTQLDLQNSTSSSRCSGSIEVVFVAGCVALIMRVLQCFRVGYDNKSYFCAPVFYNTLKYLSSLLTLLFSYLYTASQPNIFAAWVVFAIISTLFSFYWDIKHDWGLLEKSRKNPFLRDNLCYGTNRLYYFLVALNLLFRLSWIFTLSPNIVASFHIMPALFSLITGAV